LARESVVLELDGVSKDYRGLRPLRIDRLTVAAGEQVAILGIDSAAAEILVNLITGAILPDRGRVTAFGRSTADIPDAEEWLASVDRFGVASHRAVLLGELDVLQNLAVPFTLDIEPLAEDVVQRVAALATEVCLAPSTWTRKVATLDPASHARIRVARSLALDPGILVLEHTSAGLASDDASALGLDVRTAAGRRGAAILALTIDKAFGHAVARQVLRWDPASGRLSTGRG
jgi:ABC-type branched-subunit amino acid transport system ATPase component